MSNVVLQKTFFPFPEWSQSKLIVPVLVQAVPSDWCWVDGMLQAPPATNPEHPCFDDYSLSGFAIQRFHLIRPTVFAPDGKTELDLVGLLCDRKLPAFVAFEEAGFGETIKFPVAREIAARYAKSGYRGWLWFYASNHRDRKHDSRARCWIDFPLGGDEESRRFHEPAGVRLEWDERYGGKREDIEPIHEACLKLGLEPYAQ